MNNGEIVTRIKEKQNIFNTTLERKGELYGTYCEKKMNINYYSCGNKRIPTRIDILKRKY